MGLIINPRGSAGAGKTEFVRRVLALYGWGGMPVERLHLDGRTRPLAYRLPHPAGGRSLAVIGHYEGTCGGCDTIPGRDGGLGRIMQLADGLASDGCDVLLEGLALSAEHSRTADLARRHRLHVLRLDTAPDRCVRQLLARRRAGTVQAVALAGKVARETAALEVACRHLSAVATVERLSFDAALVRARALLGLPPDVSSNPDRCPAKAFQSGRPGFPGAG